MKPPFMLLRALLTLWFGTAPVARFVDPVLGDLHAEHAAASSAGERRRIWLRGALLVARVLPSVMVRPMSSSFAALLVPPVALALLGILALAHDAPSAPFASLQALWLVAGLAATALIAWMSSRPERHDAWIAVGIALLLIGLAAVPSLARAESTRLYSLLGLPLEPLKLAIPFVVVGLVSRDAITVRFATGLVALLASVATARGAFADACFGWTALAVLLDARSRLARLLAPAGILCALALMAPAMPHDAAPHTDGILQTLYSRGGWLACGMSVILLAWTPMALTRAGHRPRVARTLALGFGITFVLPVVALLGGLPRSSASVAGLGYGGSGLFMLLGSAGALAGARFVSHRSQPA